MTVPNLRIVIVAWLLSALLAGCAGQAKRVDCRWGLEPINAPASEGQKRDAAP
jgi:hypothetical protein